MQRGFAYVFIVTLGGIVVFLVATFVLTRRNLLPAPQRSSTQSNFTKQTPLPSSRVSATPQENNAWRVVEMQDFRVSVPTYVKTQAGSTGQGGEVLIVNPSPLMETPVYPVIYIQVTPSHVTSITSVKQTFSHFDFQEEPIHVSGISGIKLFGQLPRGSSEIDATIVLAEKDAKTYYLKYLDQPQSPHRETLFAPLLASFTVK